jgi:hypothetical protein
MRKLLILTIFLSSLMMTSVAYAKWTKVAKGVVSGSTFYVDLERIKTHSGRVYYWFLADYLKPTKYGDISFTAYNEAECSQFRFRWLNASFYKGPMGSGTISFSHNTPDKDWTYPSPDSVDESVLKTVCNYKN